MIDKDNKLLPFARELRRNMTAHERKLWYLFLREYPVKFFKQRIIGSYIVDFYCAPAKLVVELDGSQHYDDEDVQYDSERDAYLKSQGLTVFRFSNREIDREFKAVCEKIDYEVRERLKK